MKRIAIALAVLGLAAASTAAAAGQAEYRGKTKAGTSIKFRVAGKTLSGLSTAVPVVCLETTGSYSSNSGVEIYQPPGAFRIGTTAKTKALQPAAMNRGIKATKNYTVTTASSGGRVTGTLKISYSFLRLGADPYHSLIYICSGTTTFTAAP